MSSSTGTIQHDLLKEAANWAMTFQYDTPSDSERQAFEQWRQKSPAHEEAWTRTQAVFHVFDQLPAEIGKEAVEKLDRRHKRRHTLRMLGTLLFAAPLGMLAVSQAPWRRWTADVATGTGERKPLVLPDGSQLVLNTRSAVNIAQSQTERRLHLLAGEILVTTQPDSFAVPRPFLVDTSAGLVRALGTRFSVRQLDGDTFRVAVLEHAVEVRPLAGPSRRVQAGEQADFDIRGVSTPRPLQDADVFWEQGILLAKDMRLEDVLAELGRYRSGVLRCDPTLSQLRVSGALSLKDTDAALASLAESLPLRIVTYSSYWVELVPQP